MEKIIYRKLLYDCLVFFLITLFSLSIIIWVFQSVNFLDIIIIDGRDYLVYFKFTLLNFPKIVSKILPFAIFIGFFYTLTKYEINNELIIFWNFGTPKKKLIKFLFKSSIFLIVIQIILNNYIVPKSQDKARSLIKNSNLDNLNSLIKPKKFNDTIKGLTIYSEEINNQNELINIYLKKETDNENFQITYAKKGYIEKKLNTQILKLYDGETFNLINNKITRFNFSISEFNISDLETNFVSHIKTQENSSYDLLKCFLNINDNKVTSKLTNCTRKNYINVMKEIYKRIFVPIYISILVLLTMLFIIYSKEEINYFKFKIIIFILGVFTVIFSEISIRFISLDLTKNLSLILIPFLIIISFYFSLVLKFNKFNIE